MRTACPPALEEGLLVDGFVASDAEVHEVFPGWAPPQTGADAPHACSSLIAFSSRGLVEMRPWGVGTLAELLGRDGRVDGDVTMDSALVPNDEATAMVARVSADLVLTVSRLDDAELGELAVAYRSAEERECRSIRDDFSRNACLEWLERCPVADRLATFRRLAHDAVRRNRGLWLYYDD